MKKSILSLVSIMALSGLSYAGGDMGKAVEPVIEIPEVQEDVSSLYVGLGYSYMEYESSWSDGSGDAENADGNAVTLLAGYTYNKYIGIEARYSTTLGDISYNDNDVDSEITNYGLYLKPMYTMDKVTLYGLLGYGKATVDFGDIGGDKVSESGFQWGIGASMTVMENVEVFVDYTKLYDDKGMDGDLSNYDDLDFDIDAVNVGVTYKF